MKTLKTLTAFAFIATLFTSCITEEILVDDYNTVVPATINVNQLLNAYDLWYVDINETVGYGETPFLQMAFTVSFKNGELYANNNLVGLSEQGNGFGVPIGYYDAYNMTLDVDHDIDGYDSFDVYQIDNNTIELYNPFNDTSYFLNGYQRSNFDYDFVFYDNIRYFLQEYEAWEKTYTSEYGALNEFDEENFLEFSTYENDEFFRSSHDPNGTKVNNLQWDFTGDYKVRDISGNRYLKTLTLDYDFFDNEQFELSVINDRSIELLHRSSGTVYEFTGRRYIALLKQGETLNKTKMSPVKKRKQRTNKKDNTRENTRKNLIS